MTLTFRPALTALPLILLVLAAPLNAQDTALVAVTGTGTEGTEGTATEGTEATETTDAEADAVAPEDPVFEIQDGSDVDLDAYRWTHRPVVVFADSPEDPRYHEQIAKLLEDVPALLDRDVIVFADTDPKARSALRQKLRPRGFMLVLIDKDGAVALRKPLPWSVRELSRTIDKMPMRLREVEERRGG